MTNYPVKVDIEDVLFWMDAIRNSDDRYRTLESFWKGQVRSKIWLIDQLNILVNAYPKKIVIHGGWNGVLASLLFNSRIMSIEHITSIDIDPVCKEIASTMNKRQEIEGRFKSVTCDMCTYEYECDPEIVINTSCEHITQEQYATWLEKVPQSSWIVLQSNNYFELDEHIRCANDLEDFTHMSQIRPFYRGTFDTPKYKRFMIIGKKK